MTTRSQELDADILGLGASEIGLLPDLPTLPVEYQESVIGVVTSTLETATRHEINYGDLGKVAGMSDGLGAGVISSNFEGDRDLAEKLEGLLHRASVGRSEIPPRLDTETYGQLKPLVAILGQNGLKSTRAEAPAGVCTPDGLPLTRQRSLGDTVVTQVTPAAARGMRAYEARLALDRVKNIHEEYYNN